MNVYYNIAVTIDVLLIIFIEGFKRKREPILYKNGLQMEYRYSKFLVFLFFIPITFIAASRISFIDTSDYVAMYQEVGTSYDLKMDFGGVEHGYLLFTVFLNRITPDPQILFVITSVLIDTFFLIFLYIESEDLPFSLYIFLMMIWTSSMNGMRQYVVAALVCCFWIIWSKKERRLRFDVYFVLAIAACMAFHKSVIICAVVFLIARGRFFNLGTKLMILGTIALFAVPAAYNFLFDTLFVDSTYAHYETSLEKMGFMRFLVACVPIVLIYIYQRNNKEATHNPDDRFNWMLNICVFDFCCTVLALKMVFFARLSIFTTAFTIVLIPALVKRCFKGTSKRIVKTAAILLYGLYFYYQLDAYAFMSGLHYFFEQI